MDMPRRDLWAARVPGQVFVTEQHTHPFGAGPGIVLSALIPDFDCFNGRGGRALPYLHPDGSPNVARGLTKALTSLLGNQVAATDLLAYVAGICAHSAYTRTFADELTTPGIRVLITGNPALWEQVVALGEQVIWLHSYGERFAGQDRPQGKVRFAHGDARQPLSIKPITSMPASISYDAERHIVVMGDGEFGPVSRGVWEYTVGGNNIIKSWFNYRKKEPGGKKASPLDHIHCMTWDPNWTSEAIDLLTVLTRLVELEDAQADLLEEVLAGPLVPMDTLGAAGVRWPANPKDRKPRYSISGPVMTSVTENQPTLDA